MRYLLAYLLIGAVSLPTLLILAGDPPSDADEWWQDAVGGAAIGVPVLLWCAGLFVLDRWRRWRRRSRPEAP